MSKFEKLVEGMRNSPKSVRFADLIKVMEYAGWTTVDAKGSHFKLKMAGRPTIVGVKPHGGKAYANAALVEECLEALG